MVVKHIKITSIEKNILFMINLIILIINFILWFKEINIKDEKQMSLKDIKMNFTFKNSDNFLNFSMKTFKHISNYLNKKFIYKKIRNKRKKKKK